MILWAQSHFRSVLMLALLSMHPQTILVAQTANETSSADSQTTESDRTNAANYLSAKRRLAIQEAFEDLANKKFGIRQVATQNLVNAGLSVLPEVERRALASDVDIQNNCIGIIAAIGREEEALDPAVAALERLSHDPNFDSAGKASEELEALKKHQTVRAIRLLKEAGVQVSTTPPNGQVYSVSNITQDEQCEHLKHFRYLSYLRMQGSGITDACIKALCDAPRLNYINLNSTNISPKGIAEMRSIQNLSRLLVSGNFSAEHIRALGQVKQLASANFQIPLGDEELAAVAALPVSELVLGRLNTSSKTAAIMRTVKATKVQLSMSGVKDGELKWLTGSTIPALNINISNSKELTDEGMSFLEGTTISALSLYNTGITAKAMKQIGSFKTLQSLAITNSPINDESLKHLTNLQELTALRLHGTEVTGDGMAALKAKLTNLRSMTPPATPPPPSK